MGVLGVGRTTRILVSGLGVAICAGSISGRAVSQAPASQQSSDSLFTTIARLDSAMFDAYNRCDLVRLGSFVTDDLEFYHDQTGLARGRQPLVDGVRKNICGKVRRDLIASSLEVHPLKGYGAVETGEHMFCDPRVHRVCEAATSGVAKFVVLWQLKDGTWSITRVISYDHVSKR
ncbi:MAG TPA: nuclear transport factor 2 family protein [Gemmatimonadaceae bacterium]|jgi:hypothetical protein|nr:nuclear transport factor 2 family protein [Gemmatimonadaceae bacterium]